MALDLVSKAFTILVEILLSLLLIAPAIFLIPEFQMEVNQVLGVKSHQLLWYLPVYYAIIITFFGILALTLQNNRSLKRIVKLLENDEFSTPQFRNQHRIEPILFDKKDDYTAATPKSESSRGL